jgi:hypothetical protein
MDKGIYKPTYSKEEFYQQVNEMLARKKLERRVKKSEVKERTREGIGSFKMMIYIMILVITIISGLKIYFKEIPLFLSYISIVSLSIFVYGKYFYSTELKWIPAKGRHNVDYMVEPVIVEANTYTIKPEVELLEEKAQPGYLRRLIPLIIPSFFKKKAA